MKNYRTALTLATALLLASTSFSQAASKAKVINKQDQRIQLFIRGEGTDNYSIEVIEAGQQKDIIITDAMVNGKPTFEIIGSTGNGGDPDWKLMGGRCGELVTLSDHMIVIDSLAGKTTCKNLTDDNPSASNDGAHAGTSTLTAINKYTDKRVQIFIRGEGTKDHVIEVIEPGQQREITITENLVKGKPTFEVIASTGNGGDPDWKLLGCKCGELITISDHTIVIEPTAGKTSCTNVTAKNPKAHHSNKK